jgi:hypothetical protein
MALQVTCIVVKKNCEKVVPCDFSDSDGNRENISEVDDEIAVLVSDSA